MFKQLLLPLAGVAAFIIIVGLMFQGKINFESKKTLQVAGKTVEITVADSDEERGLGLSGKSSLGEGEGMLFAFDAKDVTPSFWMKDMLIPIDIIWINDGKIVRIDKSAQPQLGEPDSKLTLYKPGQPIDYVLEVSAGFSDKNGLKLGDATEGNSIKN